MEYFSIENLDRKKRGEVFSFSNLNQSWTKLSSLWTLPFLPFAQDRADNAKVNNPFEKKEEKRRAVERRRIKIRVPHRIFIFHENKRGMGGTNEAIRGNEIEK